jgi:nicotinate-nucleotide pyrophosphorylase (carboxylating)
VEIHQLHSIIDSALNEDIGKGDYSGLSCIPEFAIGEMYLKVKQNGIIAGIDLAEIIVQRFDKTIEFNKILHDGNTIEYGDIAFTLKGNVRKMLILERLILNFMQRMSGIATHTAEYVKAISGLNCKVLDTRKTTPGLRVIEKWAVRIGGGYNHRMGLYDMIMLKDNHVDFCGNITNAILQANKYLEANKINIPIEIETRNLQEVKEVLSIGKIQRIMFDNFSIENMREAVKLVDKQFETEASGGINLQTARSYAETGVDFISVGALTHQLKSLDLSLKAL